MKSSYVLSKIFSYFFVLVLFGAVFATQYYYDLQKAKQKTLSIALSPKLAKAFDMGLHSALASFLWIETRTELPFLQNGYQKFAEELNLINTLDPKFSTPYSFSVLVLPITEYEGKVKAAIEIGERGVRDADPDWHIPFYLATVYHLYLKDAVNAAKYFDLAAQMPGIPEIIKRFAINYGVLPKLRDQTKQVWLAIYESTDDELAKERARLYVRHYEILDYLDQAAAVYKKQFGEYPKDIEELAAKKIVKEIPRDPFDLEFQMYEGGIVGIKKLEE